MGSLTCVELTVVGSSGSYPGPDSPASCYLLVAEQDGRTWRVVLDLGNGALGALQRHVDPLLIDAVLLSHLHADHCLDLCGYYVMRKYHPSGPQPRIPVHGPAGTADRMARAYDLDPDPGMRGEFDFLTWGEEPVVVGPFSITTRAVNHPVQAFALRVECDGRVLVFSGDTATSVAIE
ncbi:MAG: fold metallo-hydrolase [Nocardioidaceae bacterium]|nr:fold metallo-hydrolase [Nocardioidaceae bacterium]